ncbi:class I SAM-dependent RNA methyltransferase [Ostreiculturibacter nitratireducens]|uniref:class I SAM-dependent RNA methyltransferase n=1 Tax=Ostreiculturibacter nitratireducens TaxID=3075226 RepID=UPI0031B5F585
MHLTIDRLGHQGDGIAHDADGVAVFVPMMLPGEVVEGEVANGRMAAPKIVTPSPDRVKAPCRHYRACGGCMLMHASDAFVADWKAEVIRLALSAQGLDAPLRPTATSPARSRRRATLSGRRLKSGALLGLHARASDTVVEITDCQLLHPALMATLPALQEAVVLGGSRKGEVAFTLTLTKSGVDVAAEGGKPLDSSLFQALATLAGAADLARLSWNGEPVATRRPPAQRFGEALVVPPPGAFLQATAEGEAALLSAVREAVGGASRIADLFCGCGTFALPLAEGAEVHAAEGEAAMIAALDHGWRHAPGLRRVTTETRDLFRRPLMPDELNRFDAVVIDPPRAGCEAQARELAASKVPVIAAVSCNPVTFARDARILSEGGYRLDWVLPVDQFRWSPHVELAARFSRD